MTARDEGTRTGDSIWDIVALPRPDAAQYRQLVASSAGHSHGGMAGHEEDDADESGHHHHEHHQY